MLKAELLFVTEFYTLYYYYFYVQSIMVCHCYTFRGTRHQNCYYSNVSLLYSFCFLASMMSSLKGGMKGFFAKPQSNGQKGWFDNLVWIWSMIPNCILLIACVSIKDAFEISSVIAQRLPEVSTSSSRNAFPPVSHFVCRASGWRNDLIHTKTYVHIYSFLYLTLCQAMTGRY